MSSRLSDYIGSLTDFDLRYFLRNGFWMLALKGVMTVSGIIISVVFARIATQRAFGQYNLFVSVFALLAVLTAPGTGTVVFRAVSQGRDGILQKAIRYRLKLGLTLAPPVLLAGGYIYIRRDPTLGAVVLLSAVIYPFYYAVELWQPAFEGKQQFSKRSLYEGGTTVVRLALTILVVVVTNGDPVYVFVTFVGTQLLPNAIYAWKALAAVDNDTVEAGWKASSLRLSLVNVLYTLYDHVDKVALAFFFTSRELAIYSVAVAIGNAIRRATDSVLRIYYPSIFQSENEDILRDVKRAVPLTILMVGSLVAVAVVTLPTVIELLYTDKYAESIFFAQLYMGVIPLYVAVSIASTVLIKNEIENLYTAAVAISSVINVALYVILIPEYGIIGGILGSLGYFVVQLVLELCILYWKA